MLSRKESLHAIVRKIVDSVNPIKIILFGSASRGDDSQGSDYDILVIMPEGTHRRNTSKLLYKKIADTGLPVDIIVATPNDIEKHKNNIGLIYRSILVEGKELYAV
jgi:predicted nucleotidyltransferase